MDLDKIWYRMSILQIIMQISFLFISFHWHYTYVRAQIKFFVLFKYIYIYNRMLFMTTCVLYMTDQVLSNDARWQNVLFYKSCYCSVFSDVLLKEIRYEKEKERQ
jgi:hypothetical protein